MNPANSSRIIQVGKHLYSFAESVIPYIKEIREFVSTNTKIALENKINLLLLYLTENDEESLKELLEETKCNEESKKIFLYIIQKTIFASELENIKIFLLAKIYLYYATKTNNEQLYIYQNLLTTTDILTETDYNIIYEIEKNKEKFNNINENDIKNILTKNNTIILYRYKNNNYSSINASLKRKSEAKTFIQKMLSLGYFGTPSVGIILNKVTDYYQSYPFDINDTYEVLANYIIEYFQKYNN